MGTADVSDPPTTPVPMATSLEPAIGCCPRRFCTWLVGWTLVALVAIMTLNVFVDPFAQYSTEALTPLVMPSRMKKIQLFRAQATPPVGLVLGSSRVMKLEPDYLAAVTGRPFFNAGVNYARPEDYLAWYRFYQRELQDAPRMVLVGVDVAGFSNQAGIDPRLLAERSLSRLVPEATDLPGRFRRWQELLSWSQSVASVKSVARAARNHQPEPKESFREDGLLIYHEREQQLRSGSYDLAGAIAYNQNEYKGLMADFSRLSQLRCELFEQLASECREEGTELLVFLTPLHPELKATLEGETNYAVRRDELDSFCIAWPRTTDMHTATCRISGLSTVKQIVSSMGSIPWSPTRGG